jgi:hypothetical protein
MAQTPGAALVNHLGRRDALVVQGNQTFTADQILQGMSLHIDYHLAAHPAASLTGYLAKLERKIALGYRYCGSLMPA